MCQEKNVASKTSHLTVARGNVPRELPQREGTSHLTVARGPVPRKLSPKQKNYGHWVKIKNVSPHRSARACPSRCVKIKNVVSKTSHLTVARGPVPRKLSPKQKNYGHWVKIKNVSPHRSARACPSQTFTETKIFIDILSNFCYHKRRRATPTTGTLRNSAL